MASNYDNWKATDPMEKYQKDEPDMHSDARPIITRHVFPAIPIRSFDWQAYRRGDEENTKKHGWGSTEAAAIQDLEDSEIIF